MGCGTGLVGICTALLGAHAILTDLCALPPRAPSPTLCHERALRCDDVVQVGGLESHLDVLDALKKASRSHGRRLLKLKRRFSLGAPHNAFFSSLVSAPSPPRRSDQLGSHAMRRETTGGVRYVVLLWCTQGGGRCACGSKCGGQRGSHAGYGRVCGGASFPATSHLPLYWMRGVRPADTVRQMFRLNRQ